MYVCCIFPHWKGLLVVKLKLKTEIAVSCLGHESPCFWFIFSKRTLWEWDVTFTWWSLKNAMLNWNASLIWSAFFLSSEAKDNLAAGWDLPKVSLNNFSTAHYNWQMLLIVACGLAFGLNYGNGNTMNEWLPGKLEKRFNEVNELTVDLSSVWTA